MFVRLSRLVLMNRNLRYLLVIVAFIWSLGSVCSSQAFFDNINQFELNNGLQVIVIEDHKAPIVKQMLFYKVGSINEAIGKGGLAHLLEHLMFRGTTRFSGQQFNQIMESNGAVSNAFTSQDVTAYHQFFDVSRLEKMMEMEADRMQNLCIKEEDFAAERQIVFQERKQRIDNNPAAKFYEALKKILWQNHPYSRQVTGEDSEILNLKLTDAEEFYRQYYTPDNAVLVLSGDIEPDKAKKLAEKYFGVVKGQSQIKKSDFPTLPQDYKASLLMRLSDVELGRMVNIYAAPSYNFNKDKIYALEVLAEYMGGDKNSPLYQRLVIQDKKALNVDVSYNPISRSYGVFEISLIPIQHEGDDLFFGLKRAWDYALRKLDNEQLDMTKKKLLADLVYLEDNPENIAELVGYVAATDTDLQELKNYEKGIEQVTLEDVLAAVAYLQNEAPQVSGILYPQKGDRYE